MNLTLSVDDKLVEAARRVAQQQGTTLNELVRGYIATLAGVRSPADRARRLVELFRDAPGDSGGGGFSRDDAYEGRL